MPPAACVVVSLESLVGRLQSKVFDFSANLPKAIPVPSELILTNLNSVDTETIADAPKLL